MKNKKFELYKSEAKSIKGHTLFRIRALQEIHLFGVNIGDLGGFIEHESNLSHEDTAWVAEGAAVYGNSLIAREALISGQAIVLNSQLTGSMVVDGNAEITNSEIKGKYLTINNHAILENVNLDIEYGKIQGKAIMKNVFGRKNLWNFLLEDEAQVVGKVKEHLLIGGNTISITGKAEVLYAHAILGSDITIQDNVSVEEGVTINGKRITLTEYARISGNVTLRDNLSVSELAHVCSLNGSSQVGNLKIGGDSVVDACSL